MHCDHGDRGVLIKWIFYHPNLAKIQNQAPRETNREMHIGCCEWATIKSSL